MRLGKFITIIALFTAIISCNDNNKSSNALYEKGVVVTNEGAMGSNTGSISFYNPRTDSLYNNIFELVNNRPLGDIVQSFTAADSLGYIVVNNSQKVEVVQLNTFKSKAVIPASYPRQLIKVNSSKAYLTNGSFPGQVLVINTSNFTITDTIFVGNQPEHLLLVGSKVFVANGNWGNDSTLSVIDINTDKVIRTINVGDGASNLVTTDGQSIWVLCQGKKVYNSNYTEVILETDSHLVKLNASDYSIQYSKLIGVKGDAVNPYLLSYDKSGNIYYVEADGLHKVNGNIATYDDSVLIPWNNSSGFSIYGMHVDSENSAIYIMEPKGFSAAGKFHIYSSTGSLIHSFNAGVGPNGAVNYTF